MSEKDEWRKELTELAEAWNKRFEEFKGEIGGKFSSLQAPATSSKREGEDMPLYRCKGKDCAFSTEDIDAFVEHKIDHATERLKPAAPEAPPKKRHETVKDYLDCPECYPKFEEAILSHPKFQGKFEVKEREKEEERESDII